MQKNISIQKKYILSRFFPIAVTVFLLLGFAFSFNFSTNQGIKFGPIRILSVLTGSMEPKITRGSMIFVKDDEFDDLSEGDIITFFVDKEIVTHRIVSIDQEYGDLLTKGDANQENDHGRVSKEAVIGKFIFGIPFIGGFLLKLKTPWGMLALGLTICLGMLIKYFMRLLGGYQNV